MPKKGLINSLSGWISNCFPLLESACQSAAAPIQVSSRIRKACWMNLSKKSVLSQANAEPSISEKMVSAEASSKPKTSKSGIVISTPRRIASPRLLLPGFCSLVACESWMPSSINRGVPITPEGISLNSSPINSRKRNCIHCPFSKLAVTKSMPSPLTSKSAKAVAFALRKPVSKAVRLVSTIKVRLFCGSFFSSSRALMTAAMRYRLTAAAQCHPHILSKKSRSSSIAAVKAIMRIGNGRLSFPLT